jgi:hypothetical protein
MTLELPASVGGGGFHAQHPHSSIGPFGSPTLRSTEPDACNSLPARRVYRWPDAPGAPEHTRGDT